MYKNILSGIILSTSIISAINISNVYADTKNSNGDSVTKQALNNDVQKKDIKSSKDVTFDDKTQDSLDVQKKTQNTDQKTQDVVNKKDSTTDDKNALVGDDSSSSSSTSDSATSSIENVISSTTNSNENNTTTSNQNDTETSTVSTSISQEDVLAAFQKLVKEFNISDSDQEKWKFIINHESGFNTSATNAASGAYGLGQALPGSKMAVYGADWKTNPEVQLRWMFAYMTERYHGISGAYNYWIAHKWY